MGREVRRVPMGWAHPSDRCLFDGTDWWATVRAREEDLAEFPADAERWPPYRRDQFTPIPPAEGETPDDWGWAWYETTTEGSPMSPTFATAEQLADWLVNVHGWPSTVEQTARQARERPKRF